MFKGPVLALKKGVGWVISKSPSIKAMTKKRGQEPWSKQTLPNQTIPNSASPKPDQVHPAKSILSPAELGAGFMADYPRGQKPLREKQPALQHTGNTDDGLKLSLRQENEYGQS